MRASEPARHFCAAVMRFHLPLPLICRALSPFRNRRPS
jgi:hypothetical protein